MTKTTRVTDVYGKSYRVAADHLADKTKRMLPLFTKNGLRWTDTRAGERAAARGEATMICRDNIA